MTERFIGKLILAWLAALVLAGIGTVYTPFSLVEIAGVIGMLGTLGILAIQVHNTSNNRVGPEDSGEYVDGTDRSDTSDDVVDGDEASTEHDVGATEGLSATERRVQNELIREAYRRFAERPFTFWPTPQGEMLCSYLQDEFDDVDEEVINKVWRFSKDDGFFKRRPGKRSLTITPTTLWRAEELGEEILLDDAVQDEILDVLLQSYRADPTYPRVDRDELIEAVGRSSDVVDHNLWLLREKGYVETQAYINSSDGGYSEAEITKLGRQVSQ
ncbi:MULTISPECIES: hypothetical protein [Haloferacaceae]|uniref:Uncharacterized protein n=1 Tax=Halorubrum glutamatedens TaxID=2707018 RepID=A0ABD5QN14_9EURY|nr:hypothetical protein [Halobellus captivus]